MTVLTCNVYVVSREGLPLFLAAGATPPGWALPQLGEHVLDRGETPADDATTTPARIPPATGRGSSAKAWAEYAKANGYEVDTDAKASEIRAALEEAGIPIK